jgi:transposase, IS30 family
MQWMSRVLFTAEQRAELWEGWKSGQCIASIARPLGRLKKSGVYRVLAASGSIVPVPRRRACLALRPYEREEISRGLAVGHSIRQIASIPGREPSGGRRVSAR